MRLQPELLKPTSQLAREFLSPNILYGPGAKLRRERACSEFWDPPTHSIEAAIAAKCCGLVERGHYRCPLCCVRKPNLPAMTRHSASPNPSCCSTCREPPRNLKRG